MLVSNFNEEMNEVVVEHLGSLEVVKVSSASVERLMFYFFQKKNIPWSNLISIMLDSCNVMRGSKSGLETRIRERHCPTLMWMVTLAITFTTLQRDLQNLLKTTWSSSLQTYTQTIDGLQISYLNAGLSSFEDTQAVCFEGEQNFRKT